MTPPTRVLVIDDSAFARKTLRNLLSGHADIEVVGAARDGLEGLEKIVELAPDVVTLDLIMPQLDGLGLLRALPPDAGCRVVVVSSAGTESELAMQALELGVVELVHKPTAYAAEQLYDMRDELLAAVRAAALARPSRHAPLAVAPRTTELAPISAPRETRLVVVGASTGGPNAITQFLSSIPGNFPVPIVIALHIPHGYTDALALRLHEKCAIDVVEASERLVLRPGLAVLAQGGRQLEIRSHAGELTVHISDGPIASLYAPSVDLLFESAAKELGAGVLGVVLTGMGDDGRRGAGAIRGAGGSVLTESEASCVIYGMPRSVVESGFSSAAAPIERMAQTVLAHLK